MKIGGKVIDGPKQTILVLPRDDGDIVFRFVGVVDDSEFDKILVPPIPPTSFNVKLQQNVKKYEDPGFKQKLQDYYKMNNAWIFLQSIRPSLIEWDTVKMDEPETWVNWQADLKNAGFTMNEVNVIWATFQKCNMLNEDMLNEARNRFLASEAVPTLSVPPSSPNGEPSNTATGEPVNASV